MQAALHKEICALQPLARIDRDSASAIFRFWLTGWKKTRRAQRRAQRLALPHQGAAPRLPPGGSATKARRQTGLCSLEPWSSNAQGRAERPRRAGAAAVRRAAQPISRPSSLPASRRLGAAGARPEPHSHWLRRHRPDRAPQSSRWCAPLAPGPGRPGPTPPQGTQPTPAAPSPCLVLLPQS